MLSSFLHPHHSVPQSQSSIQHYNTTTISSFSKDNHQPPPRKCSSSPPSFSSPPLPWPCLVASTLLPTSLAPTSSSRSPSAAIPTPSVSLASAAWLVRLPPFLSAFSKDILIPVIAPNNNPASPRAFADCCRATSRRPKCCAVTTSVSYKKPNLCKPSSANEARCSSRPASFALILRESKPAMRIVLPEICFDKDWR